MCFPLNGSRYDGQTSHVTHYIYRSSWGTHKHNAYNTTKQMLDWAKGKHRGYIKTYGDEYKKLRRKAMIPFVI